MNAPLDDGRSSTFGKELMQYISSKLPYSNIDISQNIEITNPKYKFFKDVVVDRQEVLSKYSISQSTEYNAQGIGTISADKRYSEIMYANIQKDKPARVRDYRIMAAFAEVGDALDEICDEIINVDDNGNVVNITFRDCVLSDFQKDIVIKEFSKYIQYFDLAHKGWGYFRQLLCEGEIFWEHIIHAKHPTAGILGAVQVPTELVDPIYSNIQNIMVKGYIYRKPKYDPNNPLKQIGVEYIPLDKNQITYIHSGIWNENKTMRLPFIENARRAYRQLSFIEDSIVIYRLVRAPERLVFNVDVGNMPAPKAEAYLKKLIQSYWSSKTFDINQNNTVQKFNPQSMLDSFWFAKRTGSEGTNVTQLAGGCLAMDTKVPLLDGRTITLREATEEFKAGKQNWVYSCNPENGHIVPGLVSWAGVTHESAKVMKLTFDNGKELICTLDHKFPVIGRGKIEAQDLQINDSLIPLNTRLEHITKHDKKSNKYEQVYQNDTKKWEFTHKMVTNELNDIKTLNFDKVNIGYNNKQVRHHKDYNRLNNSPENIVWMNKKDHTMLHAHFSPRAVLESIKKTNPARYYEICDRRNKKASESLKIVCNTPEFRLKRSACSKKMWTNPDYRKNKTKYNSERWNDPVFAAKTKANMSLVYSVDALKALIDVINETGHCKQRYLVKYLNENLNNKFTTQFKSDNRGKKIWKNKISLVTIKNLVRKFGYKNYAVFRREFNNFNHRVVKIEYLKDPIQVGTLTIDSEEKYHGFHTFALESEVFTYNSNLGELTDLYYFMKKLYKALKVPTTRLDPQDAFRDGQEILREELKFAKFIIRMQQNFAQGLKNGFITHLQLKGIWKDLELKDQNIFLEFNVPTNFFELRESQKCELKFNNFNSIASNESISKTYAQKKYLGWTDIEIKANREFLRKDKELEWELTQIMNLGPDWKKVMEQQAAGGQAPGGEDMGGGMGGLGGGGMGGGGGSALPPDFGGAAAGGGPEGEGAPGGTEAMPTGPATTPEATPAQTA